MKVEDIKEDREYIMNIGYEIKIGVQSLDRQKDSACLKFPDGSIEDMKLSKFAARVEREFKDPLHIDRKYQKALEYINKLHRTEEPTCQLIDEWKLGCRSSNASCLECLDGYFGKG